MGYQPTNTRTLQGQGGPYPSDQENGRRVIGAESRPATGGGANWNPRAQRPGGSWGPQGVKAPSEGPAATPAGASVRAPGLGPQTQNAGTSAQAPGLGPQTMQASPYGWNPPVRQLPPGLDESGRGFTGQQGGGRRPIGPSPTYGWGAQPVKPPLNTAMNGQGTMDGSFGGDTWFGDQTGWGFQGGQPPAGVITGNTDGRRAVGQQPRQIPNPRPMPYLDNMPYEPTAQVASDMLPLPQNPLQDQLRRAVGGDNDLGAGEARMMREMLDREQAGWMKPAVYNPSGPPPNYGYAQLRNPSRSRPPSGVTTGGYGGISI